MLLVDTEKVTHVSDVVVSYSQKVLVWVRGFVAVVMSSNHEVFPNIVQIL